MRSTGSRLTFPDGVTSPFCSHLSLRWDYLTIRDLAHPSPEVAAMMSEPPPDVEVPVRIVGFPDSPSHPQTEPRAEEDHAVDHLATADLGHPYAAAGRPSSRYNSASPSHQAAEKEDERPSQFAVHVEEPDEKSSGKRIFGTSNCIDSIKPADVNIAFIASVL